MNSIEVRVRVRGIYATALTELLSKNFTIVRMSNITSTRFNQSISYDHSDVSIIDRIDREGVTVQGLAAEVDKVVDAQFQERYHLLFADMFRNQIGWTTLPTTPLP